MITSVIVITPVTAWSNVLIERNRLMMRRMPQGKRQIAPTDQSITRCKETPPRAEARPISLSFWFNTDKQLCMEEDARDEAATSGFGTPIVAPFGGFAISVDGAWSDA
jgi:hypothetical protein